MKSFLTLSLAVVVVVGLSSESLARGGRGGGGGPRGNFGGNGGARSFSGGNHGIANGAGQHKDNPTANQGAKTRNAQSKAQTAHTNASQAKSNVANGARPFSAGWYANHPGAWQYTHPHADAWAVAGFAGAAAWLGLATAGDGGAAIVDDTVTTADTGEETTDETADETAEDETESTSDATAAAHLANTPQTINNDRANYLPLGVFALAPKNQKEAAALVQISVSKQGVIRGSYYDLLTDQGHAIQGAVDKNTQRVAFTIGERGKTVFETKLADLTQPKGEVSLHFTDGQATDWTLSRYDADPSKAEQK